MDKKKMGMFLKELRKQNGDSLEYLSTKFSEAYLTVSTNAISSWERGLSIPDIDKLNFLSNYYDVTPDEILDGEKYDFNNFEDKYYIHNPTWLDKYIPVGTSKEEISSFFKTQYPDLYFSQFKMIRNNFKQYCFEYLNKTINGRRKRELCFLLDNYYILEKEASNEEFFRKLDAISGEPLSKDGMFWEILKLVKPIRAISLEFYQLADEQYLSDQYISKMIDLLEDWEKDALLSYLQVEYPVRFDRDRNSKFLESYKKEFGKEFDKGQIAKNTALFLISKGALINKNYMTTTTWDKVDYRLIDVYEDSFNKVKKPLAISRNVDGERKKFYVENTIHNHLVAEYYYTLVKPLMAYGYSFKDIFELTMTYDCIPEKVYLEIAKAKGMDINKSTKYIVADLYNELNYVDTKWIEFHMFVMYKSGEAEEQLNQLKKDIVDDFPLSFVFKNRIIGGTTVEEKEEYIQSVNRGQSYESYLKSRDKKLTQRWVSELESKPFEETFEAIGWR